MLKSVAMAHNNIKGDTMPIYSVIIRPCVDTSGYWAECDMENGGCTTQGETIQEAQKNMFEAVELYLEDYPDVKNYFLTFEVQYA